MKKNKPSWITVVGILGIILSCIGILSSCSDIIAPKILSFQKEIVSDFEGFQKEFEREGVENPNIPKPFFSMINKMLDVPEWYSKWSVTTGIVGLFIYGLALYSSICFFQIRKSAVKLFYLSSGLIIIFSSIKLAVVYSSASLIAMSMTYGCAFLLVTFIALTIFVASSKKMNSGLLL